jgi:hypothetical protein
LAKACAGTKAAVLIRAAAAAQRIRFMMLLLSVGVEATIANAAGAQ